jgi:hypothetical protein
VGADVWSVTSYNELRRDALITERWNRLHPAEPQRQPYLLQALGNIDMPIIAASDYMKVVADQITPWLPGRLTASAQMASGGAITASISGDSSKWTPVASQPPPCRDLLIGVVSTQHVPLRRSQN